MTPEERRTAEFFVKLARANLKVPAERAALRRELWGQVLQIGHIDIAPPMGEAYGRRRDFLFLEISADEEDVEADEVCRRLCDRILDHLHAVLHVLFPHGGVSGFPVKATVEVRLKRQDDNSLVADVHSRDYLTDVFWQRFLPLFQLKPCPFVVCEQCDKPFLRKDKGVTPKYCSKSCKEKTIPFASRRPEYMRERRQREREKRLRLARRAIRKGRSEQERIELLRKALEELDGKSLRKEKSRRALVQLLNKARQRQGRKQPVKEKEG